MNGGEGGGRRYGRKGCSERRRMRERDSEMKRNRQRGRE